MLGEVMLGGTGTLVPMAIILAGLLATCLMRLLHTRCVRGARRSDASLPAPPRSSSVGRGPGGYRGRPRCVPVSDDVEVDRALEVHDLD